MPGRFRSDYSAVTMPVKGGYLLAAGAGVILVWSGLKGKSWSTVFRDVISGQPITKTTANPIVTSPAAYGYGASGSGGGASNLGGSAKGLPSGTGPVSITKNMAIGKVLAARYGWATGAEWAALVNLWNSESGWNNKVWNTTASCGGGAYAYGIAQACGHGARKQTARSGVGPYPAGNLGNPPEYGGVSSATAQIAWGLAYIKQNYGSPARTPLGGY
jgi:hypothetical protein